MKNQQSSIPEHEHEEINIVSWALLIVAIISFILSYLNMKNTFLIHPYEGLIMSFTNIIIHVITLVFEEAL